MRRKRLNRNKDSRIISPAIYPEQGLDAIPVRGPLAANTVASGMLSR